MTWATLIDDEKDEVLIYTKVQNPDRNKMYDDIVHFINTTQDSLIRGVDDTSKVACASGSYTAYKLVKEGPWEIHSDDPGTLMLYKMWYDSITPTIGVKPQVTIHSANKPYGMPKHWVHVQSEP